MISNKSFPYEMMDWSLANRVLAEQHGFRPREIEYQRQKLGLRKPAPVPGRDWSGVDWTKQDSVIAAELGLAHSTVANKRRALNHPKPYDWHKWRPGFVKSALERTRVRTAGWDWTQQDCQLAEATGLTRQRIQQLRLRLGMPPAQNHRKHR